MINKFITFYLFIDFIVCQSLFNPNFSKLILFESKNDDLVTNNIKNQDLSIYFNQNIYFNSNLPNLENQNGGYFPKGYGYSLSYLIHYKNKFLSISMEPKFNHYEHNNVSIPKKEKSFSVLNDVPIAKLNYNRSKIRNLGLNFYFNDFSFGYGNWNEWWGPGVHNSLVMSNNAEGYYQFYLKYEYYKPKELKYLKIKYTTSQSIKNNNNSNYFISTVYSKLKLSSYSIGSSYTVLSGGYSDLNWTQLDAFSVIITKENLKYWDTLTEYFFSYDNYESGLHFFVDLGHPNRSFSGRNSNIYNKHAVGSNIGIRKYGAFNKKELIFGAEYTRLVQGIYYNLLPTPNWYDNVKYNYHSFNNRRWAAHSGSDSDDMLFYFGYLDDKKSLLYGINYERHGVNYNFPPEVKFETKISATFTIKNIFINLIYENEFFEHYGFVDNDKNVWNETYESGSIQRSNTILLLIESKLY